RGAAPRPPAQGSARIHRRGLSDGEQSSQGRGAPCAARQAVLFSLRGIPRPEEGGRGIQGREAGEVQFPPLSLLRPQNKTPGKPGVFISGCASGKIPRRGVNWLFI